MPPEVAAVAAVATVLDHDSKLRSNMQMQPMIEIGYAVHMTLVTSALQPRDTGCIPCCCLCLASCLPLWTCTPLVSCVSLSE